MAPARQRMKKYRENMTEETKAKVGRKDAERKRVLRKNLKPTAAQKAKTLEQTRLRVQKYRLKKQVNSVSNVHTPSSGVQSKSPVKAYKSPQTLGKAVQKVKRALPISPRKKTQVLQVLAVQYGMIQKAATGRPTCKISEKTTNVVTSFYVRDDISRLMPGKNYSMCYKNLAGTKIQCQKRILMYTLKEAYVLFCKDNPEISISWGKFTELRPKFVLSVTKKCQEVCCCPYCDNFHLLLQVLHQWNCDIPLSISSVVEGTVCVSKQRSCMKGRCAACKTGVDEVVKKYTDIKADDQNADGVGTFTVNQWNGGELVEKTYNIKEMQKELKAQLGTIRSHRYNIAQQAEELRKAKENLQHNQVIVLIDFAENFSIKHHREVMAAHWVNNKQVTIFTGVVYFVNGNGKLDQKSYAIISDSKHHGTMEVFAFMHSILCDVKEFVKDLSFVSYWSDGAAQHFKNRYNISNLTFHQSDFGVAAEWNYQESYHGKGPHDGIGAAMKRIVWNTILRKQATVCSAKDFYELVSNASESTFCAYVPATEIDRFYQDVLKRRWNETKKAVGIQTARCIKPVQENMVTMFENSGDTIGRLVRLVSSANASYESDGNDSETSMELRSIGPFQKTENESILPKTKHMSAQASSSACTSINAGDYIVVDFNGERYPGQVQEANDCTGDVFCSVLHKSGKNWKWPEKPDIEWYKPNEIICKISAPAPVSARGLFAFHADEI